MRSRRTELGHLDAAALAHDALVTDALVLAAGALVVLGRAEDPLAEQAVLLGLERAVVDRLGLLHLAVRPVADVIGGRQADLELVELRGFEHFLLSLEVVCRRSAGSLVGGAALELLRDVDAELL
jgi:hypothetical protein